MTRTSTESATMRLAQNCPKCDSSDHFSSSERIQIQGIELLIIRNYCNPCGFEEAEIQLSSALSGVVDRRGDIAKLNMWTQNGQVWVLKRKQTLSGKVVEIPC